MIKLVSSFAARFFVIFLCFVACVRASTTVYTITNMPVENIGNAEVCFLDDADVIQQRINNAIQSEEIKNISVFKDEFEKIGRSVSCRFKAVKLGITDLPAIVIDDHYVIYGITNVVVAEKQYQEYRSRQRVDFN